MADTNHYTPEELDKVRLADGGDELEMLRDIVIRCHQEMTCRYVQTDAVLRRRTGLTLEAAIRKSPVMLGVLGWPGGQADRDILTGSGSLAGN